MSSGTKIKPDFTKVLEQAAEVDDIFRDQPAPRGSNPFQLDDNEADATTPDVQLITPLSIEPVELEPYSGSTKTSSENFGGMKLEDISSVSFVDNDSLFCINRKYAALERLFKLMARDVYSFGQLIGEILRISMDQVQSESGSFIEVDHNNKHMFFRAVTGRSSQNLLSFTIPLGQGIAGFVCENQQPLSISNVDDSSIYLKSISDAVGFETRNLVAYPVVIRGITFGCIELLNRLGEPQYTDADKEVLSTICEYAAKVIEHRLVMAAMSRELDQAKGIKPTEEENEDSSHEQTESAA
jgi:GAF domain-containing protein